MPKCPDLTEFHKVEKQLKISRKKNHDRRHYTSGLPTFEEDEPVFVATDRNYVPVPDRSVYTTRERS